MHPSLVLGLTEMSVSSSQTYTLAPEAQAPIGASQLVDPSFPSFAIQVSSFPAYSGNASYPNTFSINLIRAIEERTGGPLVIRVGGTNGDFSNFNPAQTSPIEPPMQGSGVQQKFVLGPDFYEGFGNFPDTRWVYDIPFANQNHTDSLDLGLAAVHQIGFQSLDALEIGNEVDLYVGQGVRPAGWGPQNYTVDFLNYAEFLTDALNLPNYPIFQTLTLSSSRVPPWSAQAVFEDGITKGNRVKSVSLHHYEYTNTTTTLQETLMNHTFVTSGVDNAFLSDFEYMKANFPEIQIVLGEVGRFRDGGGSLDQSEGIFGSALWTADYLLYTMSLGIQNVTRVNMQLSKAFGYAAWHPVAYDDLEPAVIAPYYGHLLVADFMKGSSNFRVIEIQSDDDLLAAYAGYEYDQLKRVAIMNYDVWNAGDGERPIRNIDLKVPDGVQSVRISTLTSPGGASATSEFYWAGQTWTYANDGVGQAVHQRYAEELVKDGHVVVTVGASEAVIVTLISP
ncbi:glycoside hydrolase family 79 protein [Penicillium lagena]|uniref:glycoside hydrolase family 79 protein n=1 Tax=Penicillium lagena TaxID=94218 RepID=UPI0025415E59|nr:glycoside hydrolase family 79 protein [Penicillium lagena]KAJ5604412.1 glycoside hydrolase family 79 protein [Penicillium lagena]